MAIQELKNKNNHSAVFMFTNEGKSLTTTRFLAVNRACPLENESNFLVAIGFSPTYYQKPKR